MVEPATRVALLARPGAACDNLQAALRQAGADVVVVQDPGEGDPAAISAAQPGAVLVALEPAVEDALERYGAVLSQPGRLVIYDEVATAARREGWEAARWARHLAAKFGGHADVLPPGAGTDDTPVARPAAAPAKPPAAPQSGAPAADATSPGPMAFDSDAVHLGIEPGQAESLAQAGNGIDFGAFTPEMMAAMSLEPAHELPAADGTHPPADADADGDADFDAAPEAALVDMDADADAHATDAVQAVDTIDALEWEAPLSLAAAAPVEAPAAEPAPAEDAPAEAASGEGAEAPAPMRFTADEMSLVAIDGDSQTTPAAPVAAAASAGGVVVLAGIGGPDAVRQFLGALPPDFARPILVRQRLDGGRHDRLVRQMQRATALPVELAEAGSALVAGHVYILPDGMTTAANGATGHAFVATEAAVPVLAGLPAQDSAVLVLSGSDPAAVQEVMDAAREGAFVAGQSPEDSFDGAAAAALVAAGGEAFAASELAQRLGPRSLSLKD